VQSYSEICNFIDENPKKSKNIRLATIIFVILHVKASIY